MIVEECGDGKDLSKASISFKLTGVSIVMDFIDREGFKIITTKSGNKQEDRQVGRKRERREKAINDALSFANLSLVESAEVQGAMEKFLSKYFEPPVQETIVEECAAQ